VTTPATRAATNGILDDLFGALADPTRRALLERLLRHGPDTATRLAADSPLTRQAVVKHLQALVDAGLATPTREGREVRYAATPERLATAVTWLLESSPQWDRRIERLRRRAQSEPERLPAKREV
jgi:DNA-binding transcriptional ArsR family regulator